MPDMIEGKLTASMMTLHDVAIDKIRQLPEPLVKLVNDFVDFLLTLNQKAEDQTEQRKQPRKAGSARGLIQMSDDFDEPLEDFREYME